MLWHWSSILKLPHFPFPCRIIEIFLWILKPFSDLKVLWHWSHLTTSTLPTSMLDYWNILVPFYYMDTQTIFRFEGIFTLVTLKHFHTAHFSCVYWIIEISSKYQTVYCGIENHNLQNDFKLPKGKNEFHEGSNNQIYIVNVSVANHLKWFTSTENQSRIEDDFPKCSIRDVFTGTIHFPHTGSELLWEKQFTYFERRRSADWGDAGTRSQYLYHGIDKGKG